MTSEEIVLDERGTLCPVPVIALARAMRELPAQSIVTLLADDPAAEHDVPAWCRMKGAEFLDARDADTCRSYRIRLP